MLAEKRDTEEVFAIKVLKKGKNYRYLYNYGNTGCGVFKGGIRNSKGFMLEINISKGNYEF
jgi:hypothetical protein